MNNGLLQVLVEEDGGYRREGNNWGRSEEHSSLVVNEESQRWYWNSENIGGTALDYLILVRGMNKKTAEKIVEGRSKIITGSFFEKDEERFYVPQEKLVDLLWELGKGNREYWYKRKLTDRTIDRHRLGFYNDWFLIPLYRNEQFVNFQMRRDEPKKAITQWYRTETWEPTLVNAGILSLVDTVFITEGIVDALLLTQEGIPAVSQNTSALWSAEWFPLFTTVKKIYYIADNDKAGRNAAVRVAKSLGTSKVNIFQFEGKEEKYDAGQYFQDGGTAKEFRELVETQSKNLFEIGELNENRNRYRRASISVARRNLPILPGKQRV
jgi:hypothetical protein